jgi:hypothetical protein
MGQKLFPSLGAGKRAKGAAFDENPVEKMLRVEHSIASQSWLHGEDATF